MMMNKLLKIQILFSIILFCISGMAKEKSKKRLMSNNWYKINRIINQEIKTIKKLGKRIGPRLRYRIIELYAEKIRLQREKENKLFISAGSRSEKIMPKEYYFRQSKKLYTSLKNEAFFTIKNYPNFKSIAEIYYTLAHTSKDYDKKEITESFYQKTLQFAKVNSPTSYKAKIALGEFYYNENKYEKAVYYYKDVIQNKHDEWYTKHLYNASWCFFKTGDTAKAIMLIEKSYFMGKSKKYLNMEGQILLSIPIYYIHGNQFKRGINFFLKNVSPPTDYMIKMSKTASSNSKLQESVIILTEAFNESKKNNRINDQLKIKLELLKTFREFKKDEKYFNTSRDLTALIEEYQKKKNPKDKNLEIEEYISSTITEIKNYVGTQQEIITKSIAHNNQFDEIVLKKIISFFDFLIRIDLKNSVQYFFYQGETLYSVNKFKDASNYYIKSLEFTKKKKSKNDWMKKSANSLLAIVEKPGFTKEEEKELKIYIYQNDIKIWPKSDKSKQIFTLLFNLYLKDKEIKKSLRTLFTYMKIFPKDQDIQQKQFILIMDEYIKNKDSDKLAYWIKRLEKGLLSFTPKYIKGATQTLGHILFNTLNEEFSKTQNYATIIPSFIALYKNPKYPKDVRTDSAFNVSTLYLKKLDTENSYKWFQIAEKSMNKDDFFKKETVIHAMITQVSLLQDLIISSKMAHIVFKSFCDRKYSNKNEIFKKMIYYNLLENNYLSAINNYELGAKCQIPLKVINENGLMIVNHLISIRDIENYLNFYKKYHSNPLYTKIFKENFFDFYWDAFGRKNFEEAKKIQGFLNKLTGLPKNLESQLNFINKFDELQSKIKKTNFVSMSSEDKFDEEKFNITLEQNLGALKSLSDYVMKETQGIPTDFLITSYILLKEKFLVLYKLLLEIEAQEMPPEYVQGFKEQINGLANQIKSEPDGFIKAALNHIKKNKILSTKTNNFYDTNQFLDEIQYVYPASSLVFPIDNQIGEIK